MIRLRRGFISSPSGHFSGLCELAANMASGDVPRSSARCAFSHRSSSSFAPAHSGIVSASLTQNAGEWFRWSRCASSCATTYSMATLGAWMRRQWTRTTPPRGRVISCCRHGRDALHGRLGGGSRWDRPGRLGGGLGHGCDRRRRALPEGDLEHPQLLVGRRVSAPLPLGNADLRDAGHRPELGLVPAPSLPRLANPGSHSMVRHAAIVGYQARYGNICRGFRTAI